MHVELMRAHTPEEIGQQVDCGICAQQFRTDVVLATSSTEDRTDMGLACPACVEALGAYRPDKFPTLEEYEAAVSRFREAGSIWGSTEEASEADRQGEPHSAALAASRIGRAS